MKRHKRHEHNVLGERMVDEFNEANTVKELALIAHLYVEYFINELIVVRFTDARLIIDDAEIGTFKSKVAILKALGVLVDPSPLLTNIELIQRIRNFYAHNLLLTDEVPEQVESRIRQLQYFEYGEVCKFDADWDEHDAPLLSQLHVCGIATTNGLMELQEAIATREDGFCK